MAREGKLRVEIERVVGKSDEFKKVVNETQKFYDTYNKKSLNVEAPDFNLTLQGLKQIYDEHKKIQNLENKNSGQVEYANNLDKILSSARDFFSQTKAIFSDGSFATGFDDIISKISQGYAATLVDLGERTQYLKDQIRDVVKAIDNVGGIRRGWQGELFGFDNGDMSSNDIQDRISLLQDVIKWQKELEQLNGATFKKVDAPAGLSTEYLEHDIKGLKNLLSELEEYNSQVERQYHITTEQLARRKDLIYQANDYMAWDESDQSRAKANIKDEASYEESIRNLKEYVSERESVLRGLYDSESELFRADGIEQYVSRVREQITAYHGFIDELKNLRQDSGKDAPIVGDFGGVVEQLKEIKNVIEEIKNAFKPLTDAFASGDSAISKMLASNIEDLNKFETRLSEVYSMIETISNKQFNVQNIISSGNSAQNDLEQIRAFRQEARALFKEVQDLYEESTVTSSKIQRMPGGLDQILNFTGTMSEFDMNDLAKRIKSRSATSLGVVIDELNEWKKVLLQFNNLRNNVEAGSFNVSKYSDTSSKVNIGTKTTDKDEKDIVDDSVVKNNDVLNKVQTLGEQVKEEFNSIRAKMEETFNFSTLEFNHEAIKTIVDNIYQQFVELQTKINALDLNLNIPAVVASVDNSSVNDASKQSADDIQKENEQLEKTTTAASEAAEAKREFTEANKKLGDEAESSASDIEQETNALNNLANTTQTKNPNKWDVVKNVVDGDGNDKSETRYRSSVGTDSVNRRTEKWSYKDDNWQLDTIEFIKDYKSFVKLQDDAKKKKQKAQATLKNFMSQFNSKTAGKWSNTGIYSDLTKVATNGIGSVDDIDDILNKMQLLDAEYNKVVQSFRKGTKSMNPFVNAFNSMDEMGEKVKQVKLSFSKLKFPTDTLETQVGELPDLLDKLNKSLKPDKNGIVDIAKVAEAYGNLNAAIKAANTSISTQRKADSGQVSQLRELDKLYKQQAESAAKITEYGGKLNSGSVGAEETRRLHEKIKLEQENIKNIQKEIDAYGELYNKEGQIVVIIKQRQKAVEEVADAQAKAADKAAKAAAKQAEKEQSVQDRQNKAYGKSYYNTEKRHYDKIMANERSVSDLKLELSPDFLAKLEEYKVAFKELEDVRNKFANDPNAANNTALTNQFADAKLKVEGLRTEVSSTFKEIQKINQLKDSGSWMGSMNLDASELKNTKAAMLEFGSSLTDGKLKFEGFNAAGTEMYGVLDNGTGSLQKITIALAEGTNSLYAYQSGTKQISNSWQKLRGELMGGVKQLATMYLSFYDVIRYIKQGVTYVKEIDLAMTELKKVTDETDESYKNFLKNASETASIIGSTVSDFTDATAAFARLGYSISESSQMAQTAIVYKNVADGLDSVEESTDSIISTMKAYGIEANDTMGIIDRFNAVGNNFAITSAGIGEAMQRSASALYEGGNSIDESIALITAANSVIQNPEQVGELIAQQYSNILLENSYIGQRPEMVKTEQRLCNILVLLS